MAKKKTKKSVKKSVKTLSTDIKKKKQTKQQIKEGVQGTKKTLKHKKTSVKKSQKLSTKEKQLLEIKKKLLSQRETLLMEAEETLTTLPGEINFPDMGDQATAETDRNFILRLRDRERMLLKKIDDAIERIENNTFGICEECEGEIGIRRLQARPVTTLCIDCKIQQEEDERIKEGV